MKKKILYVYHLDVTNQLVQSGRPFGIYNEMLNDRSIEVEVLNLSQFYLFKFALFFGKVLFFFRLTDVSPIRSALIQSISQRIIKQRLNGNFQIIFSPTSLWWINKDLRVLNNVRSICCIDIHLHEFINLYGYDHRRKEADIKSEERALQNFDCVVVPSRFAQNSLAKGVVFRESDIIKVIPFGANLPSVYKPTVNYTNNIYNESTVVVNLNILVISSDWERKGGDLISRFISKLSEYFSLRLYVIGSGFSRQSIKSTVEVFHFNSLNKRFPEHSFVFDSILRSTDFFLMPSTGEAFGMAVCEALAYGVPPIISNSGGLSEFRDDLSKLPCLSTESDIEQAANFIIDFCSLELNVRILMRSYLQQLYFSRYSWPSFYKLLRQEILK